MKKIASLIVCVLLIAVLAVPAAAARLIPHVEDIQYSPLWIAEGHAALTPELTTADDEIIIPVMYYGFKDENGSDIVWDTNHPDYGPNVGQLNSNKIKPILRFYRGSAVVRDVEFVDYTPTPAVPAQAAVRIRFVEYFVSTEEVNYEFDVLLSMRGKKYDMGLTYSGMISNEIIDVYTHDYINLEHGNIAKCYFSADEVKVHLGGGVNLYSDMVYNEKYYGIAKHTSNSGQDLITSTYPMIDEVYELKTVNLKIHGDLIEFTKYENDPHYVYNLRGEYLGMTTDRLPYATKYYLSKEFIEINVDQDELDRELAREYPEPFISTALENFTNGLYENQEVE